MNYKFYLSIFFIVFSLNFIFYILFFIEPQIKEFDSTLKTYAKEYSQISGDISTIKKQINNLKAKYELIKQIQQLNKSKFIPQKIDLLNIMKMLEDFHLKNEVPIKNIEIVSTGTQKFDKELLKFTKYAITVKFDTTDVFDSKIEDFIVNKLPSLQSYLSMHYIENFSLTNEGIFRYEIKFYHY